MKKVGILLLLLLSSSAFASGGAWKMGPFGPYWDDNDWPEFTPMYWMEEFINSVGNDEDDILEWMRMNQAQNTPAADLPGNGPMSAYNNPFANPMNNPMGNAMQGNNPMNNPMGNAMQGNNPMSNPMGNAMQGNNPMNNPMGRRLMPSTQNSRMGNRELSAPFGGSNRNRNTRPRVNERYQPVLRDYTNLPDLSQAEFNNMPRNYQIEYMRALRGKAESMNRRQQSQRQYGQRPIGRNPQQTTNSGCVFR